MEVPIFTVKWTCTFPLLAWNNNNNNNNGSRLWKIKQVATLKKQTFGPFLFVMWSAWGLFCCATLAILWCITLDSFEVFKSGDLTWWVNVGDRAGCMSFSSCMSFMTLMTYPISGGCNYRSCVFFFVFCVGHLKNMCFCHSGIVIQWYLWYPCIGCLLPAQFFRNSCR